MYRLIPLRMLRRTSGVVFDEMVPSDIPKIDGIDKVIHAPNSISPGPIEDSAPPCKRPCICIRVRTTTSLFYKEPAILTFFALSEKKRRRSS